jgi:Ni,Fe-hydrogenase I cytochrome b subunit
MAKIRNLHIKFAYVQIFSYLCTIFVVYNKVPPGTPIYNHCE